MLAAERNSLMTPLRIRRPIRISQVVPVHPSIAKSGQTQGESAMRVTATEAKNRFGSLCAQAKRGPVFVEKAGQLDPVILSAEQHLALQSQHDKAGRAARRKAFEAEYADWIADQNARFEAHGIPGADLRPW